MTDYRDPNYRDPNYRDPARPAYPDANAPVDFGILVEFDVGMDRRLCGGSSRVDFCVQQRA